MKVGFVPVMNCWTNALSVGLVIAFATAGCVRVQNPRSTERYLIKFPDWIPSTGQFYTNATQLVSSKRYAHAFPGHKEETNTSTTVDFRATGLVVSADTNTRVAEINFAIDRLESTLSGITNVLLAGGMVKAKFFLGERFFSSDATVLSLATQSALESVIAPWRVGEGFQDPGDHVSGFDLPRAIGESWTVEDADVKRELLRVVLGFGEDLSPAPIEIHIQFIGFTNILGCRCFHVRTVATVKSSALPEKFQPPVMFELSKHTVSIDMTLDHIFPQDPTTTMRWARMLVELELDAVATGARGEGNMTLSGREERTEFIQLLYNGGDGTR
jgi:hypothetical protein